MANVKLTAEELQIKERIENYNIQLQDLILLKEKLQILNELDSGTTSQYGQERASGGERINKVEMLTMKRMELESKINTLECSLNNLTNAKQQLKGTKHKVVKYLLCGYKMSNIARILKLKRHQIKYIRKLAFREMNEFLKKIEGCETQLNRGV